VAADACVISAHLPRSECGLQPEFPIAFVDDRCARIEVNVEVHTLPFGHLNGAADDLSRRNFQAGVGLAAQLKLMNRGIAQNNAVVAIARASIRGWKSVVCGR
jgi:hypothetical protein